MYFSALNIVSTFQNLNNYLKDTMPRDFLNQLFLFLIFHNAITFFK